MRECSVCGLTFLSGDICPGCGSNVHQQVFSDDAGDVEPDKIPGMESFLETSAGVIPELEEEEEVDDTNELSENKEVSSELDERIPFMLSSISSIF